MSDLPVPMVSAESDKRLATLQAKAALRGIAVERDGSGGYVVRMQGQPWERGRSMR